MPSTYSDLKIQLMATGENNTTWGDITNLNLEALEDAIVGSADVTFASANVTLTLTDANTPQTARNVRLRCTGTTGGASRNLVVPSIEKPYIVQNDCADNIVVKTAAGTGVTVPPGRTMWVMSDGVNVVDVVTHLSGLTLNAPLPLAQGGTGAATAPAARTNLGATTLGANIFTITNPSAVTFPRFNADNTVSALSAADFRTAIGVGTGTGTVTSVGGTGTVNGLTLTGTVTTSGNLTLGGTLSGVSLTSAVTGVLPVANGGTGVTSSTGTNAVVLNTNPTLSGAVLTSPTLGGTAGNNSIPLATSVTNTLNTQQVRLVEERVSAGTDWTTTRSRLYTRIDVTDQTYIDLRTDTNAPGIAFGTGGSGNPVERMRITEAGLVGIGTNNPGTALDISRTSANASVRVQTNTSGNAALTLLNAGNQQYDLLADRTNNRLTLASSLFTFLAMDATNGNVGIGTQAPSTALHVNRAGATDCRLTVGNGNAAIQAGVEPGGVGFLFNNQNFSLTFGTNGAERMRIAAAGNVGIGTNDPQSQLHVQTNAASSLGIQVRQLSTNQFSPAGVLCCGPVGSGLQGGTGFYHLNLNTGGTQGAMSIAQYDENGSFQRALCDYNYNTQTWAFYTNAQARLTIDTNGDITSSNRAAAVGFKGVPPSGITSGTITTADIGRCVPATAGVTAPSGTFARGDTITIYNDSASAITITQGAGLTLRLAGTTTTGNRTLAARGMATLWYNSASEAIASGPGLT